MKVQKLFLQTATCCFLCVSAHLYATITPVTTLNFSTAYAVASDGDTLLLANGTYSENITILHEKSITLQAAPNTIPVFTGGIAHTSGNSGGSLIFDGVNITRNNNYLIDGDFENINQLAFRNLTISNINRCLLRTGTAGYRINKILFDNCIITNCGSNNYNLLYSKHAVKEVCVTHSTLYNYTNGESFFYPNQSDATNVLTFTFENNTVYKWGKDASRALCNVRNCYSISSAFIFRNNLIAEPGATALPYMLKATGGHLTAQNNLIVNYNTYDQSNAASSTVSDLTLSDLGLTALGFPDPDNGDFSVLSTSPIAVAATNGGCIGDPRWLKVVSQAVSFSTGVSPAEGGSCLPANNVYNAGDSITVTATANFGYTFSRWQTADGAPISTENPYTFAITGDTMLVAFFQTNTLYTLTVNKDGAGSQWGVVSLNPKPTNQQYEAGTVVSLSAGSNMVSSFLQWEDGNTNSQRTITMNEHRTVTASYDKIPFIVAWDFSPNEPRNNRPADYAATTDNAGLMLFYNGDGSTTNWGGSTRNFGGLELNCARRYTGYADMSTPRYFVARFATTDYQNIRVQSLVGADNNCVHSVQKLQISTDGEHFADAASLTWTGTSSAWDTLQYTLPDSLNNLSAVYIRWIGDASSSLIGTPGSTETEGFYLANVLVSAEDAYTNDTVNPVLVASTPAENSTSASATGKIILSFNERIIAGNGSATLNGKSITPGIGSTTASFEYSGLSYNTAYTFRLPSGVLTDRAGNPYEGLTLHFTTINRPTPTARLYDAVVAADETGDYTTIQAAIDGAPADRTTPWLIFVKSGSYNETVNIPATKPYIHLIGQDKTTTLIHYKLNVQSQPTNPPAYANDTAAWPYSTNNPAFEKYGLQGGSVIYIAGANFYSENISYINDWGIDAQNGPQALAMSTKADRIAFYNCKMRSFQDTWMTANNTGDRHYAGNCHIEGAVDYIYGAGDVYIENSTLYNVRSGSVIVAPNHKAGTKWGYVFESCTIDGNSLAADGKQKLGRPWHESPIAVYLNTVMKITVAAEGWSDMGTTPALFAEYGSVDVNGNPIDVSNRKTTYSYTDNGVSVTGSCKASLNATEAAQYTYENVLAGNDHWNPRELMEAVGQPQHVILSGTSLSWDAVSYALCYIIFDGDSVIGFSATNSFTVSSDNGNYYVKAANEYGSTGVLSTKASHNPLSINTPLDEQATFTAVPFSDGIRIENLQAGLQVSVYAVDGSLLCKKTMQETPMYISLPLHAIYLVKINEAVKKVIL